MLQADTAQPQSCLPNKNNPHLTAAGTAVALPTARNCVRLLIGAAISAHLVATPVPQMLPVPTASASGTINIRGTGAGHT
eukprot:1001359-Alexandrium_andersonii.AAC.1